MRIWHRWSIGLVFVAVPLLCFASVARSQGNSIFVESKTVLPGEDSVWVAVWVNNQATIWEFYLSVEVRTLTLGAFPLSYVDLNSNPAGRIENSGLGSEGSCWSPPWPNPTLDRFGVPDSNNSCSGPISNTYSRWGADLSHVSPEGFWLAADGSYCGGMPPGVDPKSPDSASVRFVLKMPQAAGSFEIDTCCIYGGHTRYSITGGEAVPSFTKGVITICDCRCQGDPQCDSLSTVLDVVKTIDRAFAGVDAALGTYCVGHLAGTVDGNTDVDCSGSTDVVDVVRMINASFRGIELGRCNPCE